MDEVCFLAVASCAMGAGVACGVMGGGDVGGGAMGGGVACGVMGGGICGAQPAAQTKA